VTVSSESARERIRAVEGTGMRGLEGGLDLLAEVVAGA
jgi:hypothetical protein